MATSLTEFVDYRAPDPNKKKNENNNSNSLFVDYLAPDPNKKKNENNNGYLSGALSQATTNKTSSGQNTAAGSNWSNNLTAMANTVSKGYPSTGTAARANLSANSGTSASQTQGNIRWMGNELTPTGQTIVDPNSMNNGNMPTATTTTPTTSTTSTTPTTSTTSTTPTTSDIPTPAQPSFGTGTSIPYGQRNYSVFSGSNADANGNNGSLVKMGADGRTVNIDQSYATKELPSYTMSEAQYGTYDTSMAKGDEYQKYIGNKGNWSDGLLETVKAIDDYDTLHTDSKKAIDSSYATAQKLNEYKDRNVKEGYSAEDLAVMSQSGLDSLNNAYKRALNSAAADYNRLGLRGSGFELGNSYGNTTDSITGQYLSNVAKLQNEIDAKGLEAAREDRFRNAEANDKNRTDVIKTALDIGNSMNDTDNKRIENIQNIQEKNRNAYSEALKTINNLFTSSDQSQRGWASQNESEHKNDYDSILKGVELGKQSQATQYSTAATILNGLLNAIGTASSGGNRDALNGAIERINQITNPKDSNSSSYLNEILKALGIPVVNNA